MQSLTQKLTSIPEEKTIEALDQLLTQLVPLSSLRRDSEMRKMQDS